MSDPKISGRQPSGTRRLVLAVVVLGLVGYGINQWQNAREEDRIDRLAEDFIDSMGPVTITYEVTGTASWADVTIETPTGTEQLSPDVPMTRKTGEPGLAIDFTPGDFVYISAQNNTELGDITCRIRASDGDVISENTSSAGFGIASCDGQAR